MTPLTEYYECSKAMSSMKLTQSTLSESLSRFRKISKAFQLLRYFLLEHGDLGAVLDYRADSLVSQACHLFNLLSVPDRRCVSRIEK